MSSPPSGVAPGLSNQTASFGALTASGAGAFKPVDANGNTVALTSYNSVVSGVITGYTPSISNGGLRFTGAAGAPNGAVLRCGYAGGTVDITISTAADTYSAATEGEATAALSAIGPAGGKTVSLRRGTWARTVVWAEFVDFAAMTTIRGEGDCFAGKGVRFTTPWWFKDNGNITLQNVEIDAGLSAAVDQSGSAPLGDIRILECWLHGVYHDPTVDWPTGYNNAPRGIGVDAAPLYVEQCLIEHFQYGIQCTLNGAHYFRDNVIRYCMADFIQVGYNISALNTAKVFERNILSYPLYDGVQHNDGIQITSIGVGENDNYTGLVMRQNVLIVSETFSRGRMQGLYCGADGSTYGRRLQDPIVCGNVFVGIHQNAILLYHVNGGTFCNNTLTHQDTDDQPSNTVTLNIGLGRSAGTIIVKRNAAEGFNLTGGATYTQADNVTLGAAGATINFSTAFDDATPTATLTTFQSVKTRRNAKVGGPLQTVSAGALGSGYGVYGAARFPGGWSYNAGMEA